MKWNEMPYQIPVIEISNLFNLPILEWLITKTLPATIPPVTTQPKKKILTWWTNYVVQTLNFQSYTRRFLEPRNKLTPISLEQGLDRQLFFGIGRLITRYHQFLFLGRYRLHVRVLDWKDHRRGYRYRRTRNCRIVRNWCRHIRWGGMGRNNRF